jgi:hypothetical protein
METEDLIKALGADAGRPGLPLGRSLTAALLLAVLLAAAVFAIVLGPRTDIAAVAETIRFLFKFVVTIVLGATAFAAFVALARPEPVGRRNLLWIAAGPLLLLAALVLEMAVVPSADWGVRLVGTNSLNCLTMIPLIGAAPLAVLVLALRSAAPTRPVLAGAVAGLAAGGIAATFYAAHCTDDSPLFVATWYPLAIAILTTAGAFAGRAFARW